MPRFTLDIFGDAANRFEAAQAEVLKEWQPSCGCDAPGFRPECRTCADCHQIRVLTQMKLSATPEETFPAALPPDCNCAYLPDIREKALEMYAQGYPVSEIQAETGVNDRQTIRHWARKAGLPPRLVLYPDEIREKCFRLYKSGKKTSQIEKLTGVPTDTINGWLHDAGMTSTVSYSAETKAQCLSLYQEGKSPTAIASLTQVPVGTVQYWVRKANLGRKPGSPRKYSEEVRQRCLQLRKEGRDYREIEVLTGVREGTVRWWFKQNSSSSFSND